MRNPNPNSRGPQRDAAAEAPIEFEDDEEYEPDDVPRNRRGDDDNGLVDAKKNKNEPAAKSLSYLQGLSLNELSDCIRECEAEVRKGRRDYDLPPGRRTANTEHYEERRLVATYQRDFIDRVLGGVKNGTIIVPNVDPARPGRYQLNVTQTWGLYLALVEQAKRLTEHNAKNMEGRLLEAQKDLQSIYREGDGFILAATKVVGMTTTGASKNGDLLKMMRSKIVVVEEAAEVLEAHIVNCLTKYCQQLIMIGQLCRYLQVMHLVCSCTV